MRIFTNKWNYFSGLSRCCRHLLVGRRRGSGFPRNGDSVNKSLGRMHAGDNGTNSASTYVSLSNYSQ